MNGSFNGILLRKITSREITQSGRGTTLYTFRTSDRIPEFEAMLRLDAPALLILSNESVEGRIANYSADLQAGFEVTIEVGA
jgi:hypothetical protein